MSGTLRPRQAAGRDLPYRGDGAMKITELGRVTENSGSPTLFETDRGIYLVQALRVALRG